MNRHQRRMQRHLQRVFAVQLPDRLTPVPQAEIERLPSPPGHAPVAAWRSNRYCVQLYDESSRLPGLIRLSICRSRQGKHGGWEAGLSWDELQGIKREVGYDEWYGVEVYPCDRDVINVANFRHLWLLPAPLPIGWQEGQP